MRRFILSTIAAGVVAAVSVAPAAIGAGKPFSGSAYQSSVHTHDCNDSDGNKVGSITYTGPDRMWPPNHKYVPTTVVATSDDGGDVTLNSTVTNSQYDGSAESNGAGHTLDDVKIDDPNDGKDAQVGQGNVTLESSGSGSVTHNISLRSERAGTVMEDRTYTLTENATIDGNSCSATFTVSVPHDMRPSNR